MQSQQLLPKGEVLQEEFFSGAKDGEDPAEQMSKAHKHQGIIAKSAPGRSSFNSLILRLCRVLARHNTRRQNRDSSRPFRSVDGQAGSNPKVRLADNLGASPGDSSRNQTQSRYPRRNHPRS